MSTVKNADRYSRLVDVCTGYGGRFNPGHLTLQLKAMRALLKEAQSSLQDVSLKTNAYYALVNDRENAFADVKPLASKIVFTLKALAMSEATLNDARFHLRIISGRTKSQRQAVPSAEADQQPVVARSRTQQSFTAIADHFAQLVNMVTNLPGYVTNEEELKPEQLAVKAALLKTKNDEVSKARLARTVTIQHRDKLLYKDAVSLVNNANRVKSYVRVLYGPGSAEFGQVKELSFTKPKLR